MVRERETTEIIFFSLFIGDDPTGGKKIDC
jgi:hypothetical protein